MRNQFKPRGLFVSQEKASCSIYESGQMVYNVLLDGASFQLDYIEISAEKRALPDHYDFYLFNYHPYTMAWMDVNSLRKLPGVKITLVLEVLPNNPFVLCPSDAFDAYCALDPTMAHPDKRVYAFPRPLEVSRDIPSYHEKDIPIIGSFGFATPGKGFELVVDAVNREFDRAVVRLNIPSGTYTDDATWSLHRQNYANYLADLCKKTAKKGIEVIVTRDFMSKEGLIKWCAENTLNCFLYNRNQPGLSATTDQAISSGRPLLVSTNETFRHIHPYIKPYPFQSLKEAIATSTPHVLEMQQDWAPEKIITKFEMVLHDLGVFSGKENNSPSSGASTGNLIMLEVLKPPILSGLRSKLQIRTRLKKLLGLNQQNVDSGPVFVRPSFSGKTKENTVLIVSHNKKQCGIHQYGLNIFEALRKSTRYSFAYAECSSEVELKNAAINTNPSLIIYNYYPATMPWLNPGITRFFSVPQLGIMHEVTQQEADNAGNVLFDFHLCPDPTLIENSPSVFKTKRLVPPYINTTPIPEEIKVGSFGFGFSDKGFERLVEQVQNEFDQATIVFRMPAHPDQGGGNHATDTATRCRNLISKPGIKLKIDHGFYSNSELLDFLASNTINAFFYDVNKERGISSVIDYALAVQRPIAITRSGMFRHISSTKPSICIENSTLKEIIGNGVAPLVHFYNEWSESAFVVDYERILDKVLGKDGLESVAEVSGYNRILDNAARKQYKPAIDTLFELVPDKLKMKIYEANIQQAFVMDTVRKFANKDSKILCVGSFEDTAAGALKKLGFVMDEIDPAINYDLDAFCQLPTTEKGSYDIVFSTSVLEHVPNDEHFVNQIADLLAPAGVAVLTCDFKDDYMQGDPLPVTDLRFYTEKDLKERILPSLVNCQLIDVPRWQNAKHDFFYAGYFQYAFASLVFRKN
jgi:SAM-dependent methyltransferase